MHGTKMQTYSTFRALEQQDFQQLQLNTVQLTIHQWPRTTSKHCNYFSRDMDTTKTNSTLLGRAMQASTSQDLPNRSLSITRQHNKVQESISKESSQAMHAHIPMNAIQMHTTQDLPASFCILEDSWTKVNTNNTKLLVRLHKVLPIVSISRRLLPKILITQKPIFIIYTVNAIQLCILPLNMKKPFQFINKK